MNSWDWEGSFEGIIIWFYRFNGVRTCGIWGGLGFRGGFRFRVSGSLDEPPRSSYSMMIHRMSSWSIWNLGCRVSQGFFPRFLPLPGEAFRQKPCDRYKQVARDPSFPRPCFQAMPTLVRNPTNPEHKTVLPCLGVFHVCSL